GRVRRPEPGRRPHLLHQRPAAHPRRLPGVGSAVRARPDVRGDQRRMSARKARAMTLSVVIPARNEAANVGITLDALRATLGREGIPYELLVVDDGSSDGTVDYPHFKLVINRLANLFIRMLFRIGYNDTTNAFKGYRAEVIRGCEPLISPHFNLTVELPLKAIVRGYSYKVLPITWRNRKSGTSSLRLEEQGSRYLFIVLYVWLERLLTKGDYCRAAGSRFEPWDARRSELERSA